MCRQIVYGRRHAIANVNVRKAVSANVGGVYTRIYSQARWSRENNTVLYAKLYKCRRRVKKTLVYRFSSFSPHTSVFRRATTVETNVSSCQSRLSRMRMRFQNVDCGDE